MTKNTRATHALTAAAPDLLAAVQAMLIIFEDQEEWASQAKRHGVSLFDFARAAVAQAQPEKGT
jgi:hypothetical protein